MYNKLQLTILLLLLVLGINLEMTACSCTPITEKFIDKIDSYDFVGQVKIISKDTIYNPENKEIWYSFTTVETIIKYSNEPLKSKFKIVDAKGFECFTGLAYSKPGEIKMIKGFFHNVEDYLIDYAINNIEYKNEKERCLELFLCDENQLNVKGDFVEGYITKKRNKIWLKLKMNFFKLIRADSFRIKNRPIQKMTLIEFERKVKKHRL